MAGSEADARQSTAGMYLVLANELHREWSKQDPLQLGKTLYHQGDLSYFEAVNKETLKNAFQRFEEEGIVVLSNSRGSKIPIMVRLEPGWAPTRDKKTGMITPKGKLWQFAEAIAQSRREG